jgi:hypothetical protein
MGGVKTPQSIMTPELWQMEAREGPCLGLGRGSFPCFVFRWAEVALNGVPHQRRNEKIANIPWPRDDDDDDDGLMPILLWQEAKPYSQHPLSDETQKR